MDFNVMRFELSRFVKRSYFPSVSLIYPLFFFFALSALSPLISSFSRPGVRDYSQLTLDLTRNELIVGAR